MSRKTNRLKNRLRMAEQHVQQIAQRCIWTEGALARAEKRIEQLVERNAELARHLASMKDLEGFRVLIREHEPFFVRNRIWQMTIAFDMTAIEWATMRTARYDFTELSPTIRLYCREAEHMMFYAIMEYLTKGGDRVTG
jgi:hypothetical protein